MKAAGYYSEDGDRVEVGVNVVIEEAAGTLQRNRGWCVRDISHNGIAEWPFQDLGRTYVTIDLMSQFCG